MEESTHSNIQHDDGSRRRSMPPHPAAKSTKRLPMPNPTHHVTLSSVQDLNDGREKWISPMRPDSRNVSGAGKSMLPPPLPTLPRLRPPLDAAKGSALASRLSLSGTSKKLNPTAEGSRRLSSVPKPSHARTSSAASVPSLNTKPSAHTRSMGHQVPPTTPTKTTTAGSIPASRHLQPSSNTRRASTLAPAKPSFNVLQTHYTPRKNPTSRLPPVPTAPNHSKRPTTSFSNHSSHSNDHNPSAATTTTTATTISAPTQQLLQELTHLHLLHSSALPTLNDWQSSAHTHFHHRFTDLAGRHTELRDIAEAQQGLLHAHVLADWGMGSSGAMVGERVERLSRNGGEVMRMVEEGGKYARVVGVWDVWFEGVETVRAAREGGGRERGVEMIEGIGDGWKAEAMVLERELGYCARELEGFGNVKEGSGLGRLLGAWRGLVKGLLEELDVLQWIEGEVMVGETRWVESKIRELGTGLDSGIEL